MKGILHDLYRLQTLDLRGNSTDRREAEILRAGIPPGMLSNYDRARARGKKGIAILRNNVCGNCRMQSPVAVMAALRAGTVAACGNCGLYLCLDPADMILAKPPVAPPPAPIRKRKPRAAKAASHA